MRASEVMTKNPVCCGRTTSIMNAAGMLRQFNVGILAVVDDPATRKLMGVVTDRDLCLMGLAETHDPTLTSVEDCMTSDPVCCHPETDVRQVLALMAKRQVRRIPVVDDEKKVQGIVALADLIRHDAVDPRDIYMALGRITAPKKRARAQAA